MSSPMQRQDLWPDFLFDEDDLATPMEILTDQAELLKTHSGGAVVATVRHHAVRETGSKNTLTVLTTRDRDVLDFDLIAKDGYEFTLFSVTSKPELPYPCVVAFADEQLDASDPEEFRAQVRNILGGPLARGVVLSLRSRKARSEAV